MYLSKMAKKNAVVLRVAAELSYHISQIFFFPLLCTSTICLVFFRDLKYRYIGCVKNLIKSYFNYCYILKD